MKVNHVFVSEKDKEIERIKGNFEATLGFSLNDHVISNLKKKPIEELRSL